MERVSAPLEFQARKIQWKYDAIESVSSKSPPRFCWASWLSQNCGPARSLSAGKSHGIPTRVEYQGSQFDTIGNGQFLLIGHLPHGAGATGKRILMDAL